MTITIDILSLILGFILGGGFVGFAITFLYFDDKWDTAFGKGWACGSEYQKKEQNKTDAERRQDESEKM